MFKIFVILPPIASVTAEIALIATLRLAIVAEIPAILPDIRLVSGRAIVSQLAPVGAPVPVVGAEILLVAANVPAIAPHIATVGADVVSIMAHVARPLLATNRLRARDRGGTGRERECQAKRQYRSANH
ncbi:MAG TPA: hypothetical protein VKP02_14470 [Gemmatimonadaceae bacterium]|nr:hypothetical protein [Gemmatimonadaceae bacterium]